MPPPISSSFINPLAARESDETKESAARGERCTSASEVGRENIQATFTAPTSALSAHAPHAWVGPDTGLVEVNVGGRMHLAAVDILEQVPYFRPLLRGTRRPSCLKVCGNPETFGHILEFARNREKFPHGALAVPPALLREADFFSYAKLVSELAVHPYRHIKRLNPTAENTCAVALALCVDGRLLEATAKMHRAHQRLAGPEAHQRGAHLEAKWCIQQQVDAHVPERSRRHEAMRALLAIDSASEHIKAYLQVCSGLPGGASVYAALAGVRGAFGDTLGQRQFLHIALTYAPSDAEIQTALATEEILAGNIAIARSLMDQAMAVKPTAYRCILSAHILAMASEDEATGSLAQMRLSAAVGARCRQAVANYGDDVEVWDLLNKYFRAQESSLNIPVDKGRQVQRFSEEAGRCSNATSKHCYRAADCLIAASAENDHDIPAEAETFIRRAIALAATEQNPPARKRAIKQLAWLLVRSDRLAEAADCFREMIRLYEHPQLDGVSGPHTSMYTWLAQLFFDQEQFEEALQHAEKARVMTPRHEMPICIGARCALAKNDWPEALRWLAMLEAEIQQTMLEMKPGDARLRDMQTAKCRLALDVHHQSGNRPEMKAALFAAWQHAPDDDDEWKIYRALYALKYYNAASPVYNVELSETNLYHALEKPDASHHFKLGCLRLARRLNNVDMATRCILRLDTDERQLGAPETSELFVLAADMLAWGQARLARHLLDWATSQRPRRALFADRAAALYRQLNDRSETPAVV